MWMWVIGRENHRQKTVQSALTGLKTAIFILSYQLDRRVAVVYAVAYLRSDLVTELTPSPLSVCFAASLPWSQQRD